MIYHDQNHMIVQMGMLELNSILILAINCHAMITCEDSAII